MHLAKWIQYRADAALERDKQRGAESMQLPSDEVKLLRSLVGRKADRIIVPMPSDSLSKPVEAVIVLSSGKGVLIDSCFRVQRAVETSKQYPQMRVRMIKTIPEYPNGHTIELSQYDGEIITSVEVTSEDVHTPTEIAAYTKAIHIEFSGAREVTITRQTYRTPSLDVFEKRTDPMINYEPNASVTQTVQTF